MSPPIPRSLITSASLVFINATTSCPPHALVGDQRRQLDLSGDNQQVASLSDYVPGSGGSMINSNTGAVSVLTLSPTGGSTTFSG